MKRSQFTLALLVAVTALLFTATCAGEPLYLDPAEDDKYLGSQDNILFWTPLEQVAGYRNIEKIGPTRRVPASSHPTKLAYQPRDLDGLEIGGMFEDEPFSLSMDEYFDQQRVGGLLVIKDGAIAYERYGLGNTEATRWQSFSVTKSVVSLLFGAAIRDGYIEGVDDKVTTYLPHLKGSVYDQTTIRNLLQMASGVEWNEDYKDPEADINQATWETLALYDYLADKPRAAEPGTVFNYNTAETNLAGSLLRSAIGNNLSSYLHFKVWEPFGMEADAVWPLTEPGGGEFGGCCLAATLRDYGRIGLFALRGGRLADGTLVLADGWMKESTTPSDSAPYYGYFWWLRPDGPYQASGVFGQGIYIDPANKLVVAIQSAREAATSARDRALQGALLQAITVAVAR